MKLLYCTICKDIIKLISTVRGCCCGESSGYIKPDKKTAVVHGPTRVVGINDKTFFEAVNNQPKQGSGKNFTSYILPKDNKSVLKA